MHKTLLNLVLTLVLIVVPGAQGLCWDQSWSEAHQSGQDAANTVLPKLDKGGKVTTRFSNPLTSNTSPLYTFDDSTGFNAQLTAPSSNAFVDLFIAPSATGDLTTVTVRQDTNFDGTFDYAYSVTSPVSGVCANGFISADPGTWNNLHYYTWTADTTGRISATDAVSMAALAGCYCINSSCGSNLVWANVDIVLKDLGGGIVSAIQQQQPLTITSTNITGTEILYYGQQSSNMGDTTGVYFSGTPHPEQYYAGGGGTLPGDAEVLNQAGDPDSFHSMLGVLNNNVGNQYTTRQCSIRNDAVIRSDVIDKPEVSVSRPYNYYEYVLMTFQGQGDRLFMDPQHGSGFYVYLNGFTASGGGSTGMGDGLSAHGNQICIGQACVTLNGATAVTVNGTGWCSGMCEIGPAIRGYSNILEWLASDGNRTGGFIFHTDESCPDGYFFWNGDGHPHCVSDTAGVNVSNTCSGIDLTNCRLMEERVCDHDDTACVYTYRKYNPTGLSPIPSCYTQVSSYTGQTWTFCAHGSSISYYGFAQGNCTFQQQTVYTCSLNGQTYSDQNTCLANCAGGTCPPQQNDSYICDLNGQTYPDSPTCGTNCREPDSGTVASGSDMWWNIHRTYACESNEVYDFSSVQQRAGHIQNTFNDGDTSLSFQDYNPDTGETANYDVTLPPREDVERCEKSCRVRVQLEDTQASLTGTTASYRDTINSFREILKPCDGDTCPLEAGETLIEGCKCTNYFFQTTSILQVIDDASHDIICSSSPP